MAEFVLELFMEEIPARMQKQAGEELQRLLCEGLKAEGLTFSGAWNFVTPRRLALLISDLPSEKPGTIEEKRGPKVGAPHQAIEGFLRSAGLSSLDDCTKRDTGKGEFWFVEIKKPAAHTSDVLARLLNEAIQKFPWPKSMRFGVQTQRWVRPLHSIVALFDQAIIPGQVDLGGGDVITFGNITYGHRFLAPEPLIVDNFSDYQEHLLSRKVMLDHRKRRDRLARDIRRMASELSLHLKEDSDLLDEVTGLTEWPVPLVGKIDPQFLHVPKEVLIASMRTHQKFFSLLDEKGALAPYFISVANIETKDNGKAIIVGNERVLRARLSDAKFFWDQDRKIRLEDRLPKLAAITFHAKLGSLAMKVKRCVDLAETLAGQEKGALAVQAAKLCKADLLSGMVGEFPELQGIMGRYYALEEGLPQEVADAIADHYRPLGPQDECPKAPVSVALALADKIDTLVGFFAIGEKPTGSKDPYALRRAGLGIIRLILENNLRLNLRDILFRAYSAYYDLGELFDQSIAGESHQPKKVIGEILDFLAERLKVALKEQGVRHDLIAAVFAQRQDDDLVRLVNRTRALQHLIESEAGIDLLAAYKRASNIVKIEEKKDDREYAGGLSNIRSLDLKEHEEKVLHDQLVSSVQSAAEFLHKERFTSAMDVMAALRQPVDAFFDKVTVNAPDPAIRENRLQLLAAMRKTLGMIADFSKIEG